MRRFVAIAIPDDVRRALEHAIAPVRARHGGDGDGVGRDLRWSDPDGWHITLAFLGEVPDDDVARVVEVVRSTVGGAPAPSSLRLADPGRFGRSVLWAGVADDPAGRLSSLGDAVQVALADAGLPVQIQPVEPHVTLARSRRRGVTDAVVGSITVPAVSWPFAAVELWRSRLGSGRPARYAVDASVPLR